MLEFPTFRKRRGEVIVYCIIFIEPSGWRMRYLLGSTFHGNMISGMDLVVSGERLLSKHHRRQTVLIALTMVFARIQESQCCSRLETRPRTIRAVTGSGVMDSGISTNHVCMDGGCLESSIAAQSSLRGRTSSSIASVCLIFLLVTAILVATVSYILPCSEPIRRRD